MEESLSKLVSVSTVYSLQSINSMYMTFGNISDYKLSLLFDSWNIQTGGEFAIAWIGVESFTYTLLIINS